MTQVTIGNPEESGSTAHKPVMNATAIAPMAIMVSTKLQSKCFETISLFSCDARKKKTNTADKESTMAMVSVTMKALRAAFFVRITLPSSSL